MADPVTWGYIITAAVGVGTSVQAQKKQKQASKDAKDAAAIERNSQTAQDTINRRAAIREERIRRSEIMQNAVNSGAAGSSGESNSISNLSASIGANLSGISGGAQTADQISFMRNKAQGNLDAANQWQTIGSTATSMMNTGIDAYQQGKSAKPEEAQQTSVVTPVQNTGSTP